MPVDRTFPPFIEALPRPEASVDIVANIVPSDHVLTMFYEVEDDLVVPAHRHGAQWGVVIRGELELEIDGAVCTYRAGDTYYVPDGALHTARIKGGYAGIDVFADADRYQPRSEVGS